MNHRNLLLVLCVLTAACRPAAQSSTVPPLLARANQLVVVTTADWDATTGVLQRYQRDGQSAVWRNVGERVPVVIGRTGLAWGTGFDTFAARDFAGPRKREGDGRSPAGVFPLTTAFGFAAADSMGSLALPYMPLTPATDCVDDTASAYYNQVVERTAVARVDWKSAEHMRQIGLYRRGVIVGYNVAPATRGRGSCIFFHIWAGPASTTAGCTALAEPQLEQLLGWLDARREPAVVQLPARVHDALRAEWGLP